MQLQLEGPDLPTLLRRVKTEAGTGAKIVRAEKVRTGGVAGFFARERFEITVEVEEGATAPAGTARRPSPTPSPTPTSLLDLADSVSDSERAVPRAPAASTVAAPTAAAPTAGAATARAAKAPTAKAAGRTSRGRAARAEVPPLPESAADLSSVSPLDDPAVSTESRGFASVLASLRASTAPAQPTSAPAQAAPAAAGPAAANPARGVDAPRVPQQRSPQPLPSLVIPAASFEAGLPLPSAAELRATEQPATGDRHTDEPAVDELPAQEPAQAPLPVPVVQDDQVGVLAVAARRELELPARTSRAVAVRPRARTAVTHPLSELGLPCHLQPADGAEATYAALVKSLRSLPKAPRTVNKAGTIIAVVGPLPEALETGIEMAKAMGLTASAVLLATSYRTLTHLPERQVVRDVEEAEERRPGMKKRRNATIVVVDAPFTAAGAAQARAYLKALAPTTTWGVVEATRKAADVATFARAVGGLDALALSALDDTADPATVLALGIPVARLEGRPATPAAWAALLTSRLAA